VKRTRTIDGFSIPGGGRTAPLVLIVDDIEDSRTVLSDFLSFRGLRVSIATDGVEALDVIERVRPDAILMDIAMPRLNGVEVTRRLRRDETTRGIPIIGMSAYTLDIGWAETNGLFDNLLMKPFDLDVLERVLVDALAPIGYQMPPQS
jgi:twitching motility two-component system response regulator PilH